MFCESASFLLGMEYTFLFLLMWTVFKVFIEFVVILLCFGSLRHVGILAPGVGIEPTPPALEGEVLTTGPPGRALEYS